MWDKLIYTIQSFFVMLLVMGVSVFSVVLTAYLEWRSGFRGDCGTVTCWANGVTLIASPLVLNTWLAKKKDLIGWGTSVITVIVFFIVGQGLLFLYTELLGVTRMPPLSPDFSIPSEDVWRYQKYGMLFWFIFYLFVTGVFLCADLLIRLIVKIIKSKIEKKKQGLSLLHAEK